MFSHTDEKMSNSVPYGRYFRSCFCVICTRHLPVSSNTPHKPRKTTYKRTTG